MPVALIVRKRIRHGNLTESRLVRAPQQHSIPMRKILCGLIPLFVVKGKHRQRLGPLTRCSEAACCRRGIDGRLRCDIRTTVDSWNPMVAQILVRDTVTGGWVHVAAALMDCSPEAQRCVPAG
jgi:hypothetical protein